MASPSTRARQEDRWSGEFGAEDIGRNRDQRLIDSNTALFRRVLFQTEAVSSALGWSIGNNLRALRSPLPDAELHAVESNPERLPDAGAVLVEASRRYVMVCEDDNPTPVEVKYSTWFLMERTADPDDSAGAAAGAGAGAETTAR
jgi:hypothetical protein